MDSPNYNDKNMPEFGSTKFLLDHIQSILQFYDRRCMDIQGGGFFQHFKVNATIEPYYNQN